MPYTQLITGAGSQSRSDWARAEKAPEAPAEALQPAPDVEQAWNQDLGQEFEVVG